MSSLLSGSLTDKQVDNTNSLNTPVHIRREGLWGQSTYLWWSFNTRPATQHMAVKSFVSACESSLNSTQSNTVLMWWSMMKDQCTCRRPSSTFCNKMVGRHSRNVLHFISSLKVANLVLRIFCIFLTLLELLNPKYHQSGRKLSSDGHQLYNHSNNK